MPNKITYTITTSDGKEHQVSKENVDKYGIQSYADAYKGATIRMRDDKHGDYDIPLTHFNDAKSQGLHAFAFEHTPTPVSQPAQPASKPTTSGKPMTAAEKAQAMDFAAGIQQGVQRSKQQLDTTMQRAKAQQKNPLNLQRVTLGVGGTKPSMTANKHVVQGESKLNAKTGKLEPTYITESGNVYQGDRTMADAEQNQIDDAKEAQLHPIDHELKEAYAERDRLTREMNRRGEELDKEALDFSWRDIPRGSGAAIHTFNSSTSSGRLADDEWKALLAAKNQNQQRIVALEAERDKAEAGFWRGVTDTFKNPSFWTFGYTDMLDTSAMLNYGGKKTKRQKDAEQAMIENTYKNQVAQSKYGKNRDFMYRAGGITAQAIPFMIEFAATDGLSGLTRAGTKAGVKIAEKVATNALTKKLIKYTGTTLGDIAAGVVMANTTGAARTASDIGQRHLGHVEQDEHGNYRFAGGEAWGTAIRKGEIAQALEYYTEKLGAHLEGLPIGKTIAKGLDKIGLSKVTAALNRAGTSQYAQLGTKIMNRAGVNGYINEVAEEEANIVLNSMLVGDNKMSDLFDGRTQADIWGGMLFSVGAMEAAPKLAGAVDYYRTKKSVKDADTGAAYSMTQEKWQPLRDQIDNATNEEMADVVNGIIQNPDLHEQEKKAALNYAGNLIKFRGFNTAQSAKAKELEETGAKDDETIIHQSMDNAYIQGHEASDEQKNDIKTRYEYAAQQLGEALGTEDVSGYSVDDFLDNKESLNDKQKQAAIDYLNAKSAYNGMISQVKDNIDDAIKASDVAIDNHTHEDGNIYPATMKVDNRKVYVVGGHAQMNDDGTGIDHAKSSESIMVRDAETGKTEMVAPSAILSVDEATNAEEEKANAAESIRQTYAQQEANKIDGTLEFNVGDTYSVIGEDNSQHTLQVIGDAVDEETGQTIPDMVMVSVDGSLQPTMLPKAQVQEMSDGENLLRLGQSLQQREQAKAAEQQSSNTYSLNDEVTLTNETGNPVRGSITADQNEDGKFEVYTEEPINGKKVNLFSAEELDALNPEVQTKEEIAAKAPLNPPSRGENEPTKDLQGQEDDTTLEAGESDDVNSALSRIPMDEETQEPRYEEADADTAWDAIVEQTNGDRALAQEVVDDTVSEMAAGIEKAEKAISKATFKGKGIQERIAFAKDKQERMAALELEKERLAKWKRIASVERMRAAAVEAEKSKAAAAERKARQEEEEKARLASEEAERQKREALNGVPDFVEDKASDARARGYRRVNGDKVDRQEPLAAVQGKEVQVKFDDKNIPSGHVALIDADELQPSHKNGQRNPLHFIDEAQPKERKDDASKEAARKIASNIRPEEITSSVTAYTGAPTVNSRGEVIQGNNRSAALKEMWAAYKDQGEKYKQYLIDHAAELGLNPDEVRAMEKPILVNMLDVDDDDAIALGQFVANDTESGGVERIKPKNVVKKLGDKMKNFASLLLRSTDEDMSFSELIDRNGVDVLKWMNANGSITPTQYKSAFDSKGNLTADAKNDLKGVMYQSIFEGGSTQLEEMFNALPAKAQKAILATAYRDYDSPQSERMVEELQNSIMAYYALSHDAQFMAATNHKDARMAVESWKRQYAIDDNTGESYLPAEKYSNFALLLATMYKGDNQSFIQGTFNKMYDLIQGTQEETLFEQPDNTPRSLVEAIKETLNIDYNGQQRNDVLVGGTTTSQRGEQGSNGDSTTGGRSESSDGTETHQGGTEADSGRSGSRQSGGGSQEEVVAGNPRLTKKEATDFIAQMELGADVAQEIPLTIENWDKEFGEDGIVSTPIGDVKMGENQFVKLMRADRNGKLGMLKPTLEYPDAIVEENSKAKEGAHTERPSSFIFIKSFRKSDGTRYYYFTSVTVSVDGKEVVVSNQEKSRNRILRLLMEGSVIWRTPKDATTSSAEKQGLDYVHSDKAEGETKGSVITPQNTTPASKDSKQFDTKQANEQKSAKSNAVSEDLFAMAERVAAEDKAKRTRKKEEAKVDTNPTEAQKEAGNYRKGHIKVDGMNVTIEQPKGSVRRGKDADGKEWESKMHNTYGYIRGTESVDGDHIDIFLSDTPETGNVFVIDQVNKDGSFDEHKVMYGFSNMESAKKAYLSNYEDGWQGLGNITEVSKEEFKKWIDSSKRKTKPFAEYSSVKTEGDVKVEHPIESSERTKPKTKNRLVTDERYEELKKRMKAKLRGQLNMGVDPEMLAIGAEMAVYHIESGARAFSEYAKGMIADLGDAIRPYLKAFYNGARDLPEMAELSKEMTPYDEVSKFDVATISKEGEEIKPSVFDTAEQISNEATVEHNAQEEAKQTTETGDVDNDVYSITKQHNNKKDIDIWVVRGKERTDKDVYMQRKQVAKEHNGYYSSFRGVNGFVFNSPEDAQAFADKVFNTENKGDYAQKSEEIMRTDNQGNPIDKDGKLIIEKVGSISDLTDEDFEHPTRSVELPAIPQNIDEAIGANGKPVVIKKNIFEKNKQSHSDLTPVQSRDILQSALYNADLYGQNQKAKRPYNWIVINTKDKTGNNRLVLLEVNDKKDNVEIVHWHYIREAALETIKRQAEREGGLILILPSDYSEEAGGLSSRTQDLSSVGKDTQSSHTKQVNEDKSTPTAKKTKESKQEIQHSTETLSNDTEAKWLATGEPKIHQAKKSQKESKDSNVFLSQKEYIKKELVSVLKQTKYKTLEEWEDKDIENYVQKYDDILETYEDYVRDLADDEKLQAIYDKSSVKTQKEIREHLTDADLDYHEFINTSPKRLRIQDRLTRKSKYAKGEFSDGTIVSGEVVRWSPTGLTVNSRGTLYTISANKVLEQSNELMNADGHEYQENGSLQYSTKDLTNNTTAKRLATDTILSALNKAGIEVVRATDEQAQELLANTHASSLLTPQGTIYGWAVDGKIYLTEAGINPDTPIHEYTHLWAEAMMSKNKKGWNSIKALLKETPVWNEVVADPSYSNITNDEDAVASEVLSRISGRENAARVVSEAQKVIDEDKDVFEKAKSVTLLNQIKRALDMFWKWVGKELFKIKKFGSINEVTDRVLYDLMHSSKLNSNDKSLIGVHNISEQKLRKVLKQGGFANPSIAVIDTDKQVHNDYGEISLILPARKINKSTGKNAGTFEGDAWTPMYPVVEKQISSDGGITMHNDINAVPKDMQSEVRNALNRWLENGSDTDLSYLYLFQQGKAPQMIVEKPKYRNEVHKTLNDIMFGVNSVYKLSKNEIKKLVELYIQTELDGNIKEYNEAIQRKISKYEELIKRCKPNSLQYRVADSYLEDIEKYGYPLSPLIKFVDDVQRDKIKQGSKNAQKTLNTASQIIKDAGLEKDFKNWVEGLNSRYQIKEVIFDGFTPTGKRRYIPNTLENVSKIMKKQGRQASAGVSISFSNFAAAVMKANGSLDNIRKKKSKLTKEHKDIEDFEEKWKEVYFDLAMKLQPNANMFDDYGFARLQEAANEKNPQTYIRNVYGITLSEEDVQKLQDLVEAIREERPALYFETKFERPVYLNEFSKAVVPEDFSDDLQNALGESGIEVFTYKRGDVEDRQRVTKQAAYSSNDIVFQIGDDNNEIETAERDKQYFEAVQRGDMDTVRRLVNEASERNGYTSNSDYQGTSAFNGAAPYGNGYFFSREKRKEAYENDEFDGDTSLDDYINSGIDPMNLDFLTSDSSYRYADDARKEAIKNLRNVIKNKRQTITMYRSVPSSVKEGSFRNGDWITPSYAYAVENARVHGWGRDFRIIEQEVPIDEVWFDGNDIAEFGYGNEDDFINDKDYLYSNTKNNRKLPDVVTYDDNGNIIPLSKRFNKSKGDPRFQIKKNTLFANDTARSHAFDKEVNEQFNRELAELTEENADTKIFNLGSPSSILLSAGVEDKPMKLYGSKLMKKAKLHGFSPKELQSLPAALTDPIAVFDNYKKTDNRSILTELNTKDGNFLVSLTIGKGIDVDFNIIASAFGKANDSIVKWINKGFATYINKEKALNYLYLSAPIAEAAENSELSSAAKIVKDFVNPNIGEEKLREGYGAYTNDELSFINDPWAKMIGKSNRTAKQRAAFAERERSRMTNRVGELTDTLHLDKVEVVTDASQLDGKRANAKGFYSKSTGKITIVIPNHANIADVEKTLLHEAVAHYGLRKLFGDHFDTFLDNVYQNAEPEIRREIVKLATKNGWDFRTATEEYLASLAEQTDFERMPYSFWTKIKQLFMKLLHSIGFENWQGGELSDNELRYILWRSYQNLKEPGRYRSILGEAEDVAKQYELKVGNYEEQTEVTSGEVAEASVGLDEVNERFNDALQKQIDGTLPKGYVYDLGMPSSILLSTGIPNLPIQLNATRLKEKATSFGHDFDLSEIKNLVKSLQHPMAIFKYGDERKAQNIVIELQQGDKNFIVGLSLNPTINGRELHINSIRNVFPKDNAEWLNWISQGKLLRVNKEKVQNLINQQRTILADVDYLDLDSIAKIVKDFENPSVEEENVLFREGEDSVDARDIYEQRVSRAMFQTQEALQDSMLGLKKSEDVLYRQGSNGQSAYDIYENAVKDSGTQTMLGALARGVFSKDARTRFKNKFAESYFDYSRSIKQLQDAIEESLGVKLDGYEDVWRTLNAKGSADAQEVNLAMLRYIAPLAEHIGNMINGKSLNGEALTLDDVEKYMNAVHGIERNKHMQEAAFRDELIKKLKSEGYSNDESEAIAEAELDNIRQGNGSMYMDIYDNARKDYSGLTALFGEEVEDTDNVDELEAAATQYANSFGNAVGKDKVLELWDKVRALTNYSLRKSYLSGLISKAQYEGVKQMYQYYVPLRGWHDGASADIYEYISRGERAGMLESALKTAKGRKSRAGDILGTMAAMVNTAIVQGNRNLVAQKFLNMALNYGEKSGLLMVGKQWYEESANGELTPLFPHLHDGMTLQEQQDEIERFEKDMEEKCKAGRVRELRKGFNKEVGLRMPKWQEQEHCVRVMRNGREHQVYVLGNPRAAQAFNGLLNKQATTGVLTDAWATWMRAKATMQTSLSPEFIFSNFQRDILTAGTGTYIKFGRKAGVEFAKNLVMLNPMAGMSEGRTGGIFALIYRYNKGTLDKSNEVERMFEEFVCNGGMTGVSVIEGKEEYQKSINKAVKRIKQGKLDMGRQAVHGLADAIEFLNSGVENSTRFAAYMVSRKTLGKSVTESVFDAKEASVNFNMKGSGAWLNLWMRRNIMYANPAIQSLRMLGTWYEASPKRFMGVLSTIIATSVTMAMLWASIGSGDGDDDNAWYKLSEWNRYNYLNIWTGNGYAHWNLSQEIRPVWALGQIAFDWQNGMISKERAISSMMTQLNNLSPMAFFSGGMDSKDSYWKTAIRAWTPTIAADFADAYIWNENFLGQKITKQEDYNIDSPEFQRAGKNTPQWAVSLSKLWNNVTGGAENRKSYWDSPALNPSALYYLAQQQLGGFGTLVTKLSKAYEQLEDPNGSLEAKNIPFVSKVWVSTEDRQSKNRVTNDKFWMIYNDWKLIDSEIRHNQSDVEKGKMSLIDLAERMTELQQNGDYMRWQRLSSVMEFYNELRTARNNGADVEKAMDELKKDVVKREEETQKNK